MEGQLRKGVLQYLVEVIMTFIQTMFKTQIVLREPKKKCVSIKICDIWMTIATFSEDEDAMSETGILVSQKVQKLAHLAKVHSVTTRVLPVNDQTSQK